MIVRSRNGRRWTRAKRLFRGNDPQDLRAALGPRGGWLVWDSNPGNAGMHPIRSPRSRALRAVKRRACGPRIGRRCSVPLPQSSPKAAPSSAPTRSRRCRRATTSPSSASCCAPPGVAVVGEMVQHRERPHPNRYLGRGKLDELKAAIKAGRRQPRRLRRRAHAAPGAQPRGGARRAGDRPHRGDPRHLRRPRAHGRGQAPGRARAARVQPRPHARPVDAPRAPRRRPRRRRHRHPGPGRVADRDRPPARARPHHRAASAASSTCKARRAPIQRAERERAAPAAASRSPATRTPASRRCSTRSPAPRSASATGSSTRSTRRRARCGSHGRTLPDDRHRRLHPQAARTSSSTRSRRRSRRPRSPTCPARRRRLARRRRSCVEMTRAVDDVLEEIGAGDQPRLLVLNKADLLDDERRARARLPPPRRRARLRGHGRGPRRARRADRRRVRAHAAPTSSCSCPTPRAGRCPSCTTSPATSSARTPPRACSSTRACPPCVAERYDRYAVNGDGNNAA